MEKSEFRIIENVRGFKIQRLFEIKHYGFAFLWFGWELKSISKEWKYIDENGNRSLYSDRINDYINAPLGYFESLEKAKEYINKILKLPIIHNLD